MALSAIVSRVHSILYGSGLGEKPAFRLGAADAGESISGQLVTFSLASGEGNKVKAGNVLAKYTPATEGDAHVVYVTSIATDAITGINGWLGSPAITASDMDSAVLAQNPTWTDYEIFEAIDTCVAHLLWPYVFDVVTATIASPNLASYQDEVPAEVEEIVSAWQIIGPHKELIPCSRQPWEVHTSVSSTGKLAEFEYINGSTLYYTYRAKFAEADEADTELTHLIALGAAAILLGAAISETTLESTKKDNAEAVAQRGSAADRIVRDFLTLRASMSEEQGRRLPQRIYVDRG
jgi:hypothetical protein